MGPAIRRTHPTPKCAVEAAADIRPPALYVLLTER
jgi:hypothetical protein